MLTFCVEKTEGQFSGTVVPFIKSKVLSPRPDVKQMRDFGDIHEGEFVLYMGANYLDLAKQKGYCPKNKGIEATRGTIFTSPKGGKFAFTYNPNIIMVTYENLPKVIWDVTLALRVWQTGSTKPALGHYGYVDDFEGVVAYVLDHWETTGKPCDLSIDLETMGLYPYYKDKDIVTVSITVHKGTADVVYTRRDWEPSKWERFLKQLTFLLNTPKVKTVGANLKFDLVWLLVKWKMKCTNFTFDTLLVGSLLNENRSNSLNGHAKEYLELGGYDDDFNATQDKSRMELVPPEDLLPYAGGDTDAVHQLVPIFRNDLMRNGSLARLYVKIIHPACRVFEKIEARGLDVDLDKFSKLRQDLNEEIHVLEQKALAMIPRKLRMKYKDDLKLSKATLLKEFLFTPSGMNLKPKMVTKKTGEPSTAHDHLVMFDDNPDVADFIGYLKQWNGAKKTLSTYVDGFLKHLRPDNRLHPTYILYNGSVHGGAQSGGTVTGRLSAKDPAIQTLPKHTKWSDRLRECYPAPPGYKFFQVDFSQGELRIAACLANEETMIAAYNKGVDLHALTGSRLAEMEFEDFMATSDTDKTFFKSHRQMAKPANFGLLYGMGAEGYREYARTSYGLDLSPQEAVGHRDAFFSMYPGLKTWHQTYKNFANRNKYIESPLGRIRHLPLVNAKAQDVRARSERQAVNSPVQSCLSDLCLWSIVEIDRQLPEDAVIIAGMTHDSCYGYVREDDCMELLSRITEIMSNLPITETFGWEHQINFDVDAELGTSMADLKEVKV